MRRLLLGSFLIAATLGIAGAQVKKEDLKTGNTASPESETSVTVNNKQIWIFYHAPSLRGRKMFGAAGLQPDETIWRLGADYATVLHTDADLDLGGLAVPKGDYTLYVDLDKGQWKLIVNKQLMAGTRHIWGINRDGTSTNDPTKELGRVALTMSKPAAPAETLKISLAATGSRGSLRVEFENVIATAPLAVK